jgi:hypothetical protein
MRHYFYLLIFLSGLVVACHSSNLQPVDQQQLDQKSGVALYLITSPANLGNDPAALDRAAVSLSESPFINYNEIESYTTSTYTFQVKDAAAEKLKGLSLTIPLAGKPFALVVDGTPAYYGYFWNPISSFSSIYPIITLDRTSDSKTLLVSLMKFGPSGPVVTDPRNDSRLLNRLKQDNKLK